MIGVGIGVGFGSGVPFSPKQLPGLQAWYRADMGITTATGVSAWSDSSGTGDSNKNLSQATGAKQPTLNATDAAYNNKPTLSFLGSSVQYLRSGTWSVALAQPDTIIVVGSLTSAGASAQRYLDGLIVNAQLIFYNQATTKNSIYAGSALDAAAVTNTSPHIVVGNFNNTTSKIWDTAKTGTAGTVGSASNLAGITIGVGGDTTTSPLTGKIAEIIMYSGTLNQTQINAVLAYLGTRYGISIGA